MKPFRAVYGNIDHKTRIAYPQTLHPGEGEVDSHIGGYPDADPPSVLQLRPVPQAFHLRHSRILKVLYDKNWIAS